MARKVSFTPMEREQKSKFYPNGKGGRKESFIPMERRLEKRVLSLWKGG